MEIRSVRLLFPCVCLSCVRVWRAPPADWAQEGRALLINDRAPIVHGPWNARNVKAASPSGIKSSSACCLARLLSASAGRTARFWAERAAEGGQCAGQAELHSLAPCAHLSCFLKAFLNVNGERNAVKVTEICSLCCSVLLRFLLRFQYAH